MPITIKSADPTPVLTVATVKQHANIDIDADDTLLEFYVKAVTAYGQRITGRRFVQAAFEKDLDEFPTGNLELLPDLVSVASVTYTDSDDVSQTLSADDYTVKTTGFVGYIEPVDSWPTGATDVLVTFDAGYPVSGGGEATTPDDIKAWLLIRVAGMYAQRENFVIGNVDVSTMPKDFIDDALSYYKVPGIWVQT